MGEVRLASQFAPELAKRNHSVIASSMTETGYELCGETMPGIAARFRIPFDLPGPIRRAFAHFNPRALVLVETEWWPNLLLESACARVPVYVINGRLSRSAYGRYRLGRIYWSSVLSAVDFFYMRSREDAGRVCNLGIDSARVRAVGTIKALSVDQGALESEFSRGVAEANGGPIWIAGCTRPGEEAHILNAFGILRKEFPDLRLWLAPRHPGRFRTVAALISGSGYDFSKWSQAGAGSDLEIPKEKVVLIDQLGVLANLYRYAAVAFVGGSLVPFGGHNPLEPALAGTPVTFGQYMEDQRDAADMLLVTGLAREVWGAESLAIAVGDYLRHPVSPAHRKTQVAGLLERMERTRAEVADDLCKRADQYAAATDRERNRR